MHTQLLHHLQEFIRKKGSVDAEVLDLRHTVCHAQDLWRPMCPPVSLKMYELFMLGYQ